jgi:hypothetical protein
MLNWPEERAAEADLAPAWYQAGSNLCLDFHGDPGAALVVYSDGNHHMALRECLAVFARRHPEAGEPFYATTPPSVLLVLLDAGRLRLGNLVIAARPHVFISPPQILDQVVAKGAMAAHVPFARSRGNVLLVRGGNPAGIRSLADLNRPDVWLFLPNPEREAVSYKVYRETLAGLARRQGVALDVLANGGRVVHGERIHLREAPEAVAAGRADAALVYYHLALRYTRVFPEYFEFVSLDGTPENPSPENVITRLHAGLIGDGGAYGHALLDFLLGREAAAIYAHHGLARLIGRHAAKG